MRVMSHEHMDMSGERGNRMTHDRMDQSNGLRDVR